jgi:threonine synthase
MSATPVIHNDATSMRFVSTRGDTEVSLHEAITAGLAPDGGLYVPRAMPRVALSTFGADDTLADTARRLLAPFFAGDLLAGALHDICRHTFIVDAPLRQLDADTHVLELFHGPTAAFKDYGARFLAACMARLPRPDNRPLTILVATSGDTGAAVGAAFHRQPGVRVVILYPDARVAARQAHQLGCFGDNVQALRVAGSFDDCQRMVKAALVDEGLQARVPMSSANSISLGRLLPQMAYYAHAALAWHRQHQAPINLVIPTGNLGNGLAALWARAAGLPIGAIRFACNANRTLPAFYTGAPYVPRDAVPTLANAMDVGAPSNFERLRALFGSDANVRAEGAAESVDDGEIRDVIRRFAANMDELLCPHTATAMRVRERIRLAGDDRAWTVVATAHPAKFDTIVAPLAARGVPVPPALAAMLERGSQAAPLGSHADALHRWLIANPG